MATNLHALLLLSDSALPLGSFAFSSGLESFLAHSKLSQTSNPNNPPPQEAFNNFLAFSLRNLGSTALPYVFAAHASPPTENSVQDYLSHLKSLDNDFDASTPCTVARRASTTQGRALLAIWTRALSASTILSPASKAITAFASESATDKQLQAHFPPLFGAVCLALNLSSDETAYLFLLSHAKAVLSAAVRASVMGPYQSQAVLASRGLQDELLKLREEYEASASTSGLATLVEEAGISVPSVEIWMGRHELLYSRIFNS